jgi:hypothetical protein
MRAPTSPTPASSSHLLPASTVLPAALAAALASGLGACGSVDSNSGDALNCSTITTALACNNFEAEDPMWTKIETNGLTALDESDPYTGKRALSAQVSATGGKAVRTRGIDAVDR